MGKSSKNEANKHENTVAKDDNESAKDKRPGKNNNKVPVLRTMEERKQEARTIIDKLTELELTIVYPPIKELFTILQKYVKEGGKIQISIPFPMINRRIKGLLPDSVNEKCWVKLVQE